MFLRDEEIESNVLPKYGVGNRRLDPEFELFPNLFDENFNTKQ
jgi:hypothetical protein